MNSLRAYFVIPAIVLSCVIAMTAGQHLVQGLELGWLGALMAAAPLPSFMGYLMLAGTARTSRYLPLPLAIAIFGLALSFYAAIKVGEILVLSQALVATSLFLIYIFWYSDLGRQPSRVLRLNSDLPEFALETLSGEPTSSARFLGRATLLLFYRGNWCPLCVAQIKELVDHYQELAALDVQVALVSSQSQRHSAALARRFSVAMEFYRDAGGAAARALEIFHQRGLPAGMEPLGYDADTVYPTVVLVDPDGKVIFLDQTDNYRLRPDPEVFLEVARKTLMH